MILTVPRLKPRRCAEGLLDEENRPRLMCEKHVQYLRKGLAGLSGGFVALARPWLVYGRYALDLLEALDEDDEMKKMHLHPESV